MHSLASHRALSKRVECRFARGSRPVPARAVRPLAASARPKRLGTASSLCAEPASGAEQGGYLPALGFFVRLKNPMVGKALAAHCEASARLEQMHALRRSAKPNVRGSAATSFARGGSFGLFARRVTQRTMRAGSVPQCALPNPSINRTSSGKPAAACYLKR
jgi:hypothetical protein